MLVSVSNAKVPQKVLKQGGKGGFVQRNFASRKGNSGLGTIAGQTEVLCPALNLFFLYFFLYLLFGIATKSNKKV